MTAIISKPEQKRLDSCDMARPKWAEFHEQRGTCGCDAFKIDELAPNDAVRVENARQNGQAQGNTKLLGKYRFRWWHSLILKNSGWNMKLKGDPIA
jgi:hypothetical protein